jgi:hypothetical protein
MLPLSSWPTELELDELRRLVNLLRFCPPQKRRQPARFHLHLDPLGPRLPRLAAASRESRVGREQARQGRAKEVGCTERGPGAKLLRALDKSMQTLIQMTSDGE